MQVMLYLVHRKSFDGAISGRHLLFENMDRQWNKRRLRTSRCCPNYQSKELYLEQSYFGYELAQIMLCVLVQ